MFRYRFALLLLAAAAACSQDYSLGPDSQRRPGVPQGKVSKFTWANSKIYPGTTRDYWVYVPAQYDGSKPACVMILQDGAGFVNETGAWRVPTVFDNLIQEHAMPVTIGVFIDPGVVPAAAGQQSRFNRSYEYDGLGARYAKFLVEEILPEIAKQYKLSSDPNDRAIAGSSSGGIAAFTAAWERPDAFRRVISFIGSFTNLRGGDVYANLIRKMEPLPLRVFLQDGSKDLDIYSGAWWLAAQTMARSLEYAGYDTRFVAGTEAHNSRHGAAILPDALRWLWRGYPAPIEAGKGGSEDRHFITEILDPGHDWELAAEGHSSSAVAVDKAGNVYLSDPGAPAIYRSGPDGKVSVFSSDSGGAGGLTFGADGRLYAAEKSRRRIAAYSPDGKVTVLASAVEPDDLAVTTQGAVYFTGGHRVWLIPPGESPHAISEGIPQPAAIRLSPDHSLLVVTDAASRFAWSFHLQPDGSLADGEPFYRLETSDDASPAGAADFAYDDQGYAYFATAMGIQICDQPGRVTAIIRRPGGAQPTSVAFGGPDGQTLYATAGGKLYRRHLRRKGAPPWTQVTLPRPQL